MKKLLSQSNIQLVKYKAKHGFPFKIYSANYCHSPCHFGHEAPLSIHFQSSFLLAESVSSIILRRMSGEEEVFLRPNINLEAKVPRESLCLEQYFQGIPFSLSVRNSRL